MTEKIIVEKQSRDDKVSLRLECLKLAVATLPVNYLALPNALGMLEARANLLLRYVETGTTAEQEGVVRQRMKVVPPEDTDQVVYP